MIDGRKVYRCKAHGSKKVNVNNQILCSKFQRKKKIIKKKNKVEDMKDLHEDYFDTNPLYKAMIEKKENT
jgi:RecJ-like exonuclease